MKKLKGHFFAALGLAVLAGSLVLSGAHATNAALTDKVQDVKVINTSADPLPTLAQGTTTVAGTVQAQQNGTWNVGITGSPTFQIGNTAASPVMVRDVDNAARQPFTDQVVSGAQNSFTVPQGKRLVIEYVSGLATITGGQKFKLIGLRCTSLANGGVLSPIGHLFTPVFRATEGSAGNLQVDSYSISQQTRLYVEPGGTVELLLTTIPGDSQSSVVISVSGYLVDVQ